VYGARPLKRTMQKAVQDMLAEKILAGDIKPGDNIVFDADSDGLTMQPAAVH